MKKLLNHEELKWRQRASERDLLEADGNTKYYHFKASRKKKKKNIVVLRRDGVEIFGDVGLVKHITDFF